MAASSPRAPSIAHAVGAAALVVTLGILLVAAPRSAPPAIAQIAPNAVQQIKDAPPEQAVVNDSGDGEEGDQGDADGAGGPGSGSGSPGPGATAGPSPSVGEGGVTEQRLKSCVGSPVPRQIEDPQSPPCAAFFSGDNGGATAPGVTADTIRIALPDRDLDTVYLKALVAFFNQRFQFYGRQLEVKVIPGYNVNEGCNPTTQTTAASTARDELDVFASFDTAGCGGLFYAREAARQKIVVANMQPLYDERELRALHPYVWSYPMSGDRMYSALGRFTCQRLVGGPVSFAGDLTMEGRQRKFGVLLADTVRPKLADFGPLLAELRACGANLNEDDVQRIQLGADNNAPAALAQDVALKWKQNNVTTAVLLSHAEFTSGTLFPAATAVGLLPEWVVSDYWEQDKLAVQHRHASTQQRAMIGITTKPPLHLLADDPAVQAIREVDPSLMAQTDADNAIGRQELLSRLYKELLLLSAGIQGAGPKLTPERFARALETLRFPNPASPLNEGLVGFPSSHSMTLDFSEAWYDTTARGPFRGEAPGAWCYVDAGRRRTASSIPKGDASFFSGKCRPFTPLP